MLPFAAVQSNLPAVPESPNPLLDAVREGQLPLFAEILPDQVLPALDVLLGENREGLE